MDYNLIRRRSNSFKIGNVGIGGTYPVSIQSMTNTDTHDIDATYEQIKLLESAGCDIVRIALPDIQAARTVYALKEKGIKIPIVADIHFDYKIALEAVKMGVDKIRINPGNIGSEEKTEAVVKACADKNIPIRIGVNSGSVEKEILKKYSSPTPRALAESALLHLEILKKFDFNKVVLSVKASNVPDMIEANRILAESTDCPLHLGVTEAGAGARGLLKSGIGIGTLLSLGIGDTLRVSLTDDPVKEIYAAKEILSTLKIGENSGMDIISCPTCGRTRINLISLYRQFEERVKFEGLDKLNIKVALMGCAVNGPGEAREADIGIAGGVGEGLLFKKGEIIRKIPEQYLIEELIREIKVMNGI